MVAERGNKGGVLSQVILGSVQHYSDPGDR